MTLYKTDFSEYTTDAQPSDWTERWDTANGSSTVIAVSEGMNGKSLTVTFSSGRYVLTWDDIGDSLTTGELLCRLKRTTNITSISLILRGSGSTAATANAYRFAFDSTTSFWTLSKYVAGTYTMLGTITKTIGTDWCWMRFRINGTALKAKVWLETQVEPGTWDIEVSNSSLSSGWAGIAVAGSIVMSNSQYLDYFACETDSGSWPITVPIALADAKLNLSVYFQKLKDFTTYLRAHDGMEFRDFQTALETVSGLILKDASLNLDVKGQLIEDFMMCLQAGKQKFGDLATYLSASDGYKLKDLLTWLSVTDGNVLKDLGLYLHAISATPAFRAVTAHRVNSVIHEVV